MTRAQRNEAAEGQRQFLTVILIGSGLVLFLVGFLLLTARSTPEPRQYHTQQITLVEEAPPPTPPPPPPPEEKVETPKEVLTPVEQAEVQDDVEDVSPDPEPSPSTELAGLNRPADLGADSFHLAAGKGGGLFGRGGGAGGSWSAFVATHIRKALRSDPRTRSAAGYLELLLVIDLQGRFERAELQSSTGDSALDAAIRDVLAGLSPLRRGRPASVDALTVTAINLVAAER